MVTKVRNYFLENEPEAVKNVMTISGRNFGGQGQNLAMSFVKLKDWEKRQRPDLKVKPIAGRAMGALSQIKEAKIFAFRPRQCWSWVWPMALTFSSRTEAA